MSPSPADVTLYGEGWTPTADSDVPGVSTVDDSDVLHWLGFIGGDLPSVHHLMLPGGVVTIAAGGGGSYTLEAVDGVPPYDYDLLAPAPHWATLGGDTLAFAPSRITEAKEYPLHVQVTDSNGRIADAYIIVTVTG